MMRRCFYFLMFFFLVVSRTNAQESKPATRNGLFAGGNVSSLGGVGVAFHNSGSLADFTVTSILPYVNNGRLRFFNVGFSFATHIRDLNQGYLYSSLNGALWYAKNQNYSTGLMVGFAYYVPNTNLKMLLGGGYGYYKIGKGDMLGVAAEVGLYYSLSALTRKEQ